MHQLNYCICIVGTEEKENFLFELSGFLSEYGCPYKSLVSGVATDRLNNKQDCLKLICKFIMYFYLGVVVQQEDYDRNQFSLVFEVFFTVPCYCN